MKRSGIFITILLSLFMFQSLWNVAAAFCDHESTMNKNKVNIQRIVVGHFGHHVAVNCAQDQKQHANQMPIFDGHGSKSVVHDDQNNNKLNDFLSHLDDDHSDHLPSFAHFMVADIQQSTEYPPFTAYPFSTFSDWKNLYQSPHLFLNNPPPIYSPL